MNPDESDLNLVFPFQANDQRQVAPASAENRTWFTYENFSRANNNQIRGLRKQLKDSPFRAQVEKQIADKEMELVAKQHELMAANPDTYIAKFLGWKNPKYPGSQGNFFDDIDPMDNSLIRSMAISDRIQGFMVAYSKGNDPGFLACIDMVKAHFEPNPATLESALYSMLEGFYNTGKGAHLPVHPRQLHLRRRLRRRPERRHPSTRPRHHQPSSGQNTTQLHHEQVGWRNAEFMETAKANKYTLVMFWASWCHKCEQEIPVLIPVYAKYQNRGFEAIGVSLDQARSTWVGVIEQRGMQYPNVSQLQGWDSPIVKDYKITSTPTYFLLDSEGKIVLKPKRIYEVDAFLAKNL